MIAHGRKGRRNAREALGNSGKNDLAMFAVTSDGRTVRDRSKVSRHPKYPYYMAFLYPHRKRTYTVCELILYI